MFKGTFNPESAGHQALLAHLNLRCGADHSHMLKSVHADALHALLKKDTNHEHRPPANPKAMIRRASPDMTLTPAQRQRAQREESRQETEQLHRMSEARTNGGINDEDDEVLGADGVPVTRGSKRVKGSFERLKKSLAAKATDSVETLIKSLQTMYSPRRIDLSVSDVFSFEERFGKGFTHTARVVSRPAAAKTTIASIRKSMADIAKSLGNTTLAKSLEAGYGTDSATLTGGSGIRKQSLPTKPVAKPLSPDELLKAASTLLHHGRIDTQTAARVQSEVNLTGKVSPTLMKTLSEACK